jgi:hypothetical protein
MLSLLPTDGSTVDLLEWWYRFTLDASTDYLFGESVGSLRDPKVSHVPYEIDCSLALQMRLPSSKNISPFSEVWDLSGDCIDQPG